MIVAPIILLVFIEPDLGTTGVITLTAFTMWYVAGGNLFHLAAPVPAAFGACRVHARLPDGPGPGLAGPMVGPLGDGFHTVQGLLALGVGGMFGTGLGRAGSSSRTPQRLHLRRDRPGVRLPRGGGRDRPVRSSWRTLASGPPWRRPTRSARCWPPASPAGSACRRSSTSRSSSRLADHRHHPAVHQRRRVVAHHQLRGGRYPALDLAGDLPKGTWKRCGS